MNITTLVIDDRKSGVYISLHLNKQEALSTLRQRYAPETDEVADADLRQFLADGVVTYIEEHEFPVDTDELSVQLVEAYASSYGDSNDDEIEAWRGVGEEAAHLLGLDLEEYEAEGLKLHDQREESE